MYFYRLSERIIFFSEKKFPNKVSHIIFIKKINLLKNDTKQHFVQLLDAFLPLSWYWYAKTLLLNTCFYQKNIHLHNIRKITAVYQEIVYQKNNAKI